MAWSHPSASLSGSLHPKGEAYNAKACLRLSDDLNSLYRIDEEYGLFKKFLSVYGQLQGFRYPEDGSTSGRCRATLAAA